MTKKTVWRDKQTCDFDGYSVDAVISRLSDIKEEFGGNARFDLHTYDWEDKEYLFIQVEEEETDEECASRLKQEAYYKELKDKREREEYQRLQAKFGE